MSKEILLENVQSIGSDSERAKFNGLQRFLTKALNVLCLRHVTDDLRRKMTDLGLSDRAKSQYIHEIFGDTSSNINRCLQNCLADSGTREEFEDRLKCLQDVWNSREKSARNCDKPQFYNWFCKHAAVDIREKCAYLQGRHVVYSHYYNNANESINAKLKRIVGKRILSWSEFFDVLKELAESQERNVERALIRRGPYRLAEEYKTLELKESHFCKMTRDERFQLLKKFAATPLVLREKTKGRRRRQSNSVPSEDSLSHHTTLAFALENTTLPKAVFAEVRRKAIRLVQNEDSIVDVPGNVNAKLVASSGGGRPNFVQFGRSSGKLKCDCMEFAEKGGMCAHTVAVVEETGCLKDHISSYLKGDGLSVTRVA